MVRSPLYPYNDGINCNFLPLFQLPKAKSNSKIPSTPTTPSSDFTKPVPSGCTRSKNLRILCPSNESLKRRNCSIRDSARGCPVCQIFNDEEFQIFEFREDLEYFWQDGYGFEINFEPGCVLMKDILASFDQVVQVSQFLQGLIMDVH